MVHDYLCRTIVQKHTTAWACLSSCKVSWRFSSLLSKLTLSIVASSTSCGRKARVLNMILCPNKVLLLRVGLVPHWNKTNIKFFASESSLCANYDPSWSYASYKTLEHEKSWYFIDIFEIWLGSKENRGTCLAKVFNFLFEGLSFFLLLFQPERDMPLRIGIVITRTLDRLCIQ